MRMDSNALTNATQLTRSHLFCSKIGKGQIDCWGLVTFL